MLQHIRSCGGWRSWTCSNSGPRQLPAFFWAPPRATWLRLWSNIQNRNCKGLLEFIPPAVLTTAEAAHRATPASGVRFQPHRQPARAAPLLAARCIGSGSGRADGHGRNVGVTICRKPLIAGSLTAGSGWWVIRRVPRIRAGRDCRTGRHWRTRAVILRRRLGLSRRDPAREQQGCGGQSEGILCHVVSFLCSALGDTLG